MTMKTIRKITLRTGEVFEIDHESWPFLCSKSIRWNNVNYFLGARQHRTGKTVVYCSVNGADSYRSGEILYSPNHDDLLESLCLLADEMETSDDSHIINKMLNKCVKQLEGK